jgi:methyl-accepting chemotaxis protein
MEPRRSDDRASALGTDEVARLMRALQALQASLRAIVSQVRASTDAVVISSAEVSLGAKELSGRSVLAAASLTAPAGDLVAGVGRFRLPG